MPHDFAADDLAALRALQKQAARPAPSAQSPKKLQSFEADGRKLRAATPATAPRAAQLNVRVRDEIKQKAIELAAHHRYTITDVIETAIDKFYAATMGEGGKPSP